MTQSLDRGSAKILQFPVGGRAGLRVRRTEPTKTTTTAPLRTVKVASGGAWYHEEAMRECESARKN